MTPELALILGLVVVLGGMMIWLYKAGGKGFKAKVLEQEKKDREQFDLAGEEWDGRGGLGGIIMRRKSGSLRKKLGLGK